MKRFLTEEFVLEREYILDKTSFEHTLLCLCKTNDNVTLFLT
jgi:hypothetical protein